MEAIKGEKIYIKKKITENGKSLEGGGVTRRGNTRERDERRRCLQQIHRHKATTHSKDQRLITFLAFPWSVGEAQRRDEYRRCWHQSGGWLSTVLMLLLLLLGFGWAGRCWAGLVLCWGAPAVVCWSVRLVFRVLRRHTYIPRSVGHWGRGHKATRTLGH